MQQKRKTRAHILEAARSVLSQQGLSTTTARDIAAEAGVAVGTVFLHFPTMGALAETILDDTVAPALALGAQGPAESLVDRLVQMAAALYDAYSAEPELARQVIARSLFESSIGGPSEQRMAAFAAWVDGEVTAAIDRKEIPPIDSRSAFMSYFALYFGGLVAGLRGELDRETQLSVLRESLHRLFA